MHWCDVVQFYFEGIPAHFLTEWVAKKTCSILCQHTTMQTKVLLYAEEMKLFPCCRVLYLWYIPTRIQSPFLILVLCYHNHSELLFYIISLNLPMLRLSVTSGRALGHTVAECEMAFFCGERDNWEQIQFDILSYLWPHLERLKEECQQVVKD